MAEHVILAQSSWPTIDYTGVEQTRPPSTGLVQTHSRSAIERAMDDPTSYLLVGILIVLIVGLVILPKKKGKN